MRYHLGRGRVDAGGDGDTLFGDVDPELLDLPIRVCELARQRPRFLSSHRPPPVSALRRQLRHWHAEGLGEAPESRQRWIRAHPAFELRDIRLRLEHSSESLRDHVSY